MTRLRPTSPAREAAHWYASTTHWPVTAGVQLTPSGRCSCDEPDCPLPGAHPIGRWGSLPATTDAQRVRETWDRSPAASIIAPTGRRFDVLDVPLTPGREALLRFELMDRCLGPVAEHGDRLLFWVASGARLLHHLHPGVDCRHQELGVNYRSEGDFVTLPPTRQTRWVIPPTAYDHVFPTRTTYSASSCRHADSRYVPAQSSVQRLSRKAADGMRGERHTVGGTAWPAPPGETTLPACGGDLDRPGVGWSAWLAHRPRASRLRPALLVAVPAPAGGPFGWTPNYDRPSRAPGSDRVAVRRGGVLVLLPEQGASPIGDPPFRIVFLFHRDLDLLERTLPRCVDALTGATREAYEVVVHCDGTPPGIAERLPALLEGWGVDELGVRRRSEHTASGDASNNGHRRLFDGRSRYLIVVEDDVVMYRTEESFDVLAACRRLFETYPDVPMLCKVDDYEDWAWKLRDEGSPIGPGVRSVNRVSTHFIAYNLPRFLPAASRFGAFDLDVFIDREDLSYNWEDLVSHVGTTGGRRIAFPESWPLRVFHCDRKIAAGSMYNTQDVRVKHAVLDALDGAFALATTMTGTSDV